MAIDLTEGQQALVQRVTTDFHRARRRHQPFRRNCERRYRMYRSYQESRSYARENPRDRDEVLRSLKREWGAELFIPYCFSVVETILPRMLTASPTMTFLPGNPVAEENIPETEMNVEAVQLLHKRQQDQIDYNIRLQDVAKSGLIYGLGVQKTYWKTEYKEKRVLRPAKIRRTDGVEWETTLPTKVVSFDDPFAESVDIFDFFWDPFASEIANGNCEYVIHRTWRSSRYVKRMVESGAWAEAAGWDLEELLKSSGPDRRDESWRARDLAGGMTTLDRAEVSDSHEIWEYHDGVQVITVLNGQWPVSVGDNPYWHGELPFQVYRPTKVPNELVGIGELEPIEDLQSEMNTLRSQRRDNATLKLQQVFAYMEGAVDPAHLKFGPGVAIPVNGPPGDFLTPINVGDIPNSGYQEEANLLADIVRTTGIDDTQSGSSPLQGAQTATGAQLVQAAANVRIQQKALLLEVEVVKPAARQWLALNQQKIRKTRLLPGPPSPEAPDQRWSWVKVGPPQLAGELLVDVVGGSSQPDNVPQMRQDGEQLFQALAGNQQIDQTKLYKWMLEKFQVRNPESYILPPPPMAPGMPGQPGAPGQEGQEPPPAGAGVPSQPPGPGPQGGAPGMMVIPANALELIVAGLHDSGMNPTDAQHLVFGAIMHARQMDAGQIAAPQAQEAPPQGAAPSQPQP